MTRSSDPSMARWMMTGRTSDPCSSGREAKKRGVSVHR